MRAYHFLPATWALDDIAKQRIKISEIDQTNDPFELWCVSQPDRKLRDGLRAYKRKMSEKYGLICFSENWTNPLLWSHYADKHRGICLGFDVNIRRLRKVTYVKERPALRLPLSTKTTDDLLWTKFWDWRYEKEWRSWLRLDEREDGHYFYYFNAQGFIRLREVIVGPLCETTETEIGAVLQGYSDQVEIIKARLAFNSFKVVIKQNRFQPC